MAGYEDPQNVPEPYAFAHWVPAMSEAHAFRHEADALAAFRDWVGYGTRHGAFALLKGSTLLVSVTDGEWTSHGD